MKLQKILAIFTSVVGISTGLPSYAQDNKPLRVIVPFTSGSGSDDSSRFYADQLSKKLDRTVIVENKPGASGSIAVQSVLSAPADGNTILLGSNSLIAVNPVVMKDLSYSPFDDLEPLHGLMISSPAIIVAADSPYKKIQDLVDAYKKNKTPLLTGTYSEGYKLVADWIANETGIEMTSVPYKGGSQMVTDLIGGRLDFAQNDQTGVLPLIAANKIRALAITGAQRDDKMPDTPTMLELGYKNFESYVWSSFSVKSGTPLEVKMKLAKAITDLQKSPDAIEYASKRAGTVLALSLDKLGEFQKLEYQRFKNVFDTMNK